MLKQLRFVRSDPRIGVVCRKAGGMIKRPIHSVHECHVLTDGVLYEPLSGQGIWTSDTRRGRTK